MQDRGQEKKSFLRMAELLAERYPRTEFYLCPSKKLQGVIRKLCGQRVIENSSALGTDKCLYYINAEMIPFFLKGVFSDGSTPFVHTRPISSEMPGEEVFVCSGKKRIRIGVAWKSTETVFGIQKSYECMLLEELFKIQRGEFVSLQKGMTADEIEYCAHNKIETLGGEVWCDWNRVYQVIEGLDIIVSCSTAVAHLAAALGKKTIVLLGRHHANGWMWNHDEKGKSDWYPDAHIYRQEESGNWDNALRKAREDIDQHIRSKGHR